MAGNGDSTASRTRTMNITLGKIREIVPIEKHSFGDTDEFVLHRLNAIGDAVDGDVTFCVFPDSKGLNMVLQSKASLIICHTSLEKKLKGKSNYIFTDNPRYLFFAMMKSIIDKKLLSEPKARHSPIPDSAYVDPHTHIGSNVTIGEHSKILYGVYIHDETTIGKNCTIAPNAVLGNRGFGVEHDAAGSLLEIPHIGGVTVGNDVEIGAGAKIDRGVMNDTVIGNECKIDNNVHVGHNAILGDKCVIVANSVVGGSCVLGRSVFAGMGALIKDNLRIGDHATLGMGSVILKDVEPNSTVVGNPARHLRYS